tara:strand:+ start:8471 stop:12097 length:3627 start_codon:yes stop_codon:yes gene_type:complete
MAGQGSARVTLREIDLSQVSNPQELPQGVPAAVVGPARKGPAFVPQTFANMQQFNETFGSMLENRRESNSNLFGPLALNEWMRNAKSGTYLRILGVGNGKASDNTGKVEDAGFVVGNKLVQEKNADLGKVADNPFAYITNSNNAVTRAKTHMLGCFMRDVDGSRFLCDAGVQQETAQASLPAAKLVIADTAAEGDVLQIFLPKELVNKAGGSVEEDVTISIVIKTAVQAAADVPANTIQLKDEAGATAGPKLFAALTADVAAGTAQSNTGGNAGVGDLAAGKDFMFSDLPFNPSLMFAGSTNNAATIVLKLVAGREGDEAYIVESAGTHEHFIDGAAALNEKLYFDGAAISAPVIRGVLMAPQGVIPALNPASAITALTNIATTYADGASTVSPEKTSHELHFGETTAAGANDTKLVGYVVGEVGSNQDFKLVLNGFKNTEKPSVLDCSLDPSSPSYISKVLNTDPTKIEECGHYLYSHWDIDSSVAVPSNDGLSRSADAFSHGSNSAYADMIGFLMPGAGATDYDSFEDRFQTAKTPWIVSQFFSKSGDNLPRPETESAGEAYKLFRLCSLDDGEVSNSQYRLLIENVRYSGLNQFGAFDLSLEKYDSDPISGQPVLSFKNLSLDVSDRNFIGRVIGDKYMYFDLDRDEDKQRLVEDGQYAQKNKLVRVEFSEELLRGEVPVEAIPAGFQGHSYVFTSQDDNFVEPAANNLAIADRVFINADDSAVTQTLSKAQVLPLDFVRSINRKVAGVLESDDDLAWGVKLSSRKNSFDSNKELIEQEFNRSILSWAKFYPKHGSSPVLRSQDNVGDYQKLMFSLEKILIPSRSIVDDAIVSWDGAEYQRDAAAITPPAGARYVNLAKDAAGGNARYLKFRCLFQGGFDGVNIFDKNKAEFTGAASLRESADETGTSKFTGPTVVSYKKAIDVLSDKSVAEFQLLAIPGQRASEVTDHAITACEERFDAMLIMDIAMKDMVGTPIEDDAVRPSVRKTIKDFSSRDLNTSFAAAYFPDVLMRRPSDRAPIVVPPSVGMLGVMSQNDSIADPWFAPAGLSRGRLRALDSNVSMNRDLLDELYDADINPIYVPAGRSGEVYAFGQKTLLQDQSALDRINVRRLLIDLRRKVRKVGEQLLFEPNRESTLVRFSSLVEPIMADVQQRRGVTRYKVQIDTTTTTQNDIENNTIRGKIYLQPTKSVEFISLDFVVTNTIQE